jgi:branched-chain amino acid transport system substrate-binding protein
MREKPVEDFFARNGKLREDNLMVHDLMLVQVKSPEESKYPWDYYKIPAKISGDDAFGPPNPECSLVKRWQLPPSSRRTPGPITTAVRGCG